MLAGVRTCAFPIFIFSFFFNDPATTEIYTLSLHDALPISRDSAGIFWTIAADCGNML